MAINAATLMVKIGADTADAERGIASVNQRLNTFSRNAGMTGGVLTAGMTLPLMAIGKAALSSAAEFEQSMNVTQQVLGATTAEMGVMQDAALDWGAESVFSAGEVMNAMQEGAKAGLSYQEIMAAMPGIIDLAAASGEGLAASMGVTAAALNTFGLDAGEATSIANMFAAAANASAASIPDLAIGMQQAGAAFAATGQTLPDLLTSLAVLTNVGYTGSDAGTALKNAMVRLIDPTQEAKDLMNELGISFYDTQGNMLAFPQIIDVLNGGLAGLTQEQRNSALMTLFLSDGFKAMDPILRLGSDGFLEMRDAVEQEGAAAGVATARMAGLTGGVEYFRGSVDSFLIGAAAPFLGFLGDAMRGAGDLVTSIGELPTPILNTALGFGLVAAAAGPMLLVIAGMAAGLSVLLSPIGLVVVAVAALAAAWAADFGGIRQATAEAWAAMQPHLDAMRGWLETEGPGALDTLQGAWGSAWGAMQGLMSPLISRMAYEYSNMVEGFGGLGPKFEALYAAAEGPLTRVMQLAGYVGVVIGVVLTAAINLVAAVLGRLPDVVGIAVDQVTATLTLIGTTVEGMITLVTALISGDWAGAWTAAQDIFTGFVTFFGSTSERVSALVALLYGALRDTVVNTLGDMGVSVSDQVTAVENQVREFWGWLTGLTWGDVLELASGGFTSAVDALTSWGWPESPGWFMDWGWPEQPNWFDEWEWPGIPGWLSDWEFPMPSWLGHLFDETSATRSSIDDFFSALSSRDDGGGGSGTLIGGPGDPIDDTGRGNFPAAAATAMAAGGAGNVVIYANVANNIDLNELALRVGQMLRRRG